MSTKKIAIITIFASLYYVLGIIFQPISFMAIQIRVACALIPLIAIYGNDAVIGITIGHLTFNFNSPIGVLDLLSPFIFLIARLAITKYGLKVLPLHIFLISIWVGLILNHVFNLPLIETMVFVGLGEAIAELGLGLPLFYAIKRSDLKI